jgi:hypothetical protein
LAQFALARDWLWRKARFDGAQFYVNVAEIEESRRIITHEYPGSELHDLEDLGRNARRLSVTAYFVSETADSEVAALRGRLAAPGAGQLTIPMFGSIRCRAVRWSPHWEREALNYVGFSIEFLEEGSAFAPIASGLAAVQLARNGARLGGIFGASIGGAVSGQKTASFVTGDTTREVHRIGARLAAIDASAGRRSNIDDILKQPVGPGDLASLILTEAHEISNAFPEQKLWCDEAAGAVALYNTAIAAWDIDDIAALAALAYAAFSVATAARFISTDLYTNRRDAIAGRSMIAYLAGQLLPSISPLGVDAEEAVHGMTGMAATHLSEKIIDLAPVVLIETIRPLPANVLAWRLYGDPSRSIELVERNHVATPCFMPTRFEATVV